MSLGLLGGGDVLKDRLKDNMFSPELVVRGFFFPFQYLSCSFVSVAVKEVDGMQIMACLGQIMLWLAYC